MENEIEKRRELEETRVVVILEKIKLTFDISSLMKNSPWMYT